MDLGRVIFVDAGQIVHTNLKEPRKELVELDLQGRHMALTPMGDDIIELDFRGRRVASTPMCDGIFATVPPKTRVLFDTANGHKATTGQSVSSSIRSAALPN